MGCQRLAQKQPMVLVHTTKDGVEVYVERDDKSTNDFRVKFKKAGEKRLIAPSHLDLVIELYVKSVRDSRLTLRLRDRLLQIYDLVPTCKRFPPTLTVFKRSHARRFANLGKVGEFSVELLLVVSELLSVAEKSSGPSDLLNQRLHDFGTMERYSVIEAAVGDLRRGRSRGA